MRFIRIAGNEQQLRNRSAPPTVPLRWNCYMIDDCVSVDQVVQCHGWAAALLSLSLS